MITPLIPPGIAMILYGCIANVSIGKLFISGFGVGGLLSIPMMILVGVISKKRGYGILSNGIDIRIHDKVTHRAAEDSDIYRHL